MRFQAETRAGMAISPIPLSTCRRGRLSHVLCAAVAATCPTQTSAQQAPPRGVPGQQRPLASGALVRVSPRKPAPERPPAPWALD